VQIARSNFGRNPQYENKITLYEFGLGALDETIEVEYSPEWNGQTGRQGLSEDMKRISPSWKETIKVRNASDCFLEVLNSAGSDPVILKMDCEGAEWEILPDLARSGVLKRIDQMVFEWHHKQPEPLEQLLVENGFSVIRRTDSDNCKIGVIYATNINHRT
jgi:FkbM family methyltransferase